MLSTIKWIQGIPHLQEQALIIPRANPRAGARPRSYGDRLRRGRAGKRYQSTNSYALMLPAAGPPADTARRRGHHSTGAPESETAPSQRRRSYLSPDEGTTSPAISRCTARSSRASCMRGPQGTARTVRRRRRPPGECASCCWCSQHRSGSNEHDLNPNTLARAGQRIGHVPSPAPALGFWGRRRARAGRLLLCHSGEPNGLCLERYWQRARGVALACELARSVCFAIGQGQARAQGRGGPPAWRVSLQGQSAFAAAPCGNANWQQGPARAQGPGGSPGGAGPLQAVRSGCFCASSGRGWGAWWSRAGCE